MLLLIVKLHKYVHIEINLKQSFNFLKVIETKCAFQKLIKVQVSLVIRGSWQKRPLNIGPRITIQY
jgi:hypothetical protein